MNLVIDRERQEAKGRLEEILEQLSELGEEAEQLIDSVFPEESTFVSAYKLCQFGTSGNPYDNSLEKVVGGLEVEFEEED